MIPADNFAPEQLIGKRVAFKDDANHPDPSVGWSPDRAARFGRNTLESVLVCLDSLR